MRDLRGPASRRRSGIRRSLRITAERSIPDSSLNRSPVRTVIRSVRKDR